MHNLPVLAALMLLLGLQAPGLRAADGPPPMPVEAEAVQAVSLEHRLPAVGSLRGDEAVLIRPEIAGRVTEILFDEGERVEQGDVLMRLDADILKAELAEAQANLGLSRLSYQRAEDLLRRGAGSTADRDRARFEMDANRASMRMAQARLERTVLRAPFSGVLGLRMISPGDYVLAGQDLVRLVTLDPLKLDFSVPEVEAARISAGQLLNIQVDAFPGELFGGKVLAVEAALDPASRALAVRGLIENPQGRLRPGMFARVNVVLERLERALTLPESAIVPRGTASFVFRVSEGVVQEVKVTPGLRREGRVQIVSGLEQGDVIVTAGQLKIRDGAAVTVVSEGTPE